MTKSVSPGADQKLRDDAAALWNELNDVYYQRALLACAERSPHDVYNMIAMARKAETMSRGIIAGHRNK